MCVLIFFTNLSETILILRSDRDVIKIQFIGPHIMCSLFLSDLNFLYRFSKNIQISKFIKSRPVGADLFHAGDGQTDVTTITVAFLNFAKAPKNVISGKNTVKNY